ncbi:autism susceptibility gene 2 protein-like isoform X3 [Anthonomus grandis grandis]|uniref:autism susceptibility gene 2 protein-like isoform X3 n=1 Tax=Anthonomus grandis grandis TaxID=2921223 RepID=UPI00216677F2|nr:autism susceptibility gene 2 protein-like isoform X3 [Anthonomus grandis grandis]
MEIEVKQRNRRRKRAQRMQQQLKETHVNKANADESETEDVIHKKPPRPPNRRKKQKDLLKEPLCEEDIIEGFSILQFRSYEDLELVVKIAAKEGIKRLTEVERPKLEPKAHITNHILVHNNHNGLTLNHDPATSDDSGRASERLTGSSVVSVAPRERDADSSRDRLSDASSRCSSGKGYICDSEGEDDKGSDASSVIFPSAPSGRKHEFPGALPPSLPSLPHGPGSSPVPAPTPLNLPAPSPAPAQQPPHHPPQAIPSATVAPAVGEGAGLGGAAQPMGSAVQPQAATVKPEIAPAMPSAKVPQVPVSGQDIKPPTTISQTCAPPAAVAPQQPPLSSMPPATAPVPPPAAAPATHHHPSAALDPAAHAVGRTDSPAVATSANAAVAPTPGQYHHSYQPLYTPYAYTSNPPYPSSVPYPTPPPSSTTVAPSIPPQQTPPINTQSPAVTAVPLTVVSQHQPTVVPPVSMVSAATTHHQSMDHSPIVAKRPHSPPKVPMSPRGVDAVVRERESYSSVTSLSRSSVRTTTPVQSHPLAPSTAVSSSLTAPVPAVAQPSPLAKPWATPASVAAPTPTAPVASRLSPAPPRPTAAQPLHGTAYPPTGAPPLFAPPTLAAPVVSTASPLAPTAPTATNPNPFSAESLFQTNQADMLRRELDNRFLASQDRALGVAPPPYLRTEMHQHQHHHTHVHQHTTSLLPPPSASALFSSQMPLSPMDRLTRRTQSSFKDIPKIGSVDSPFYRQGLGVPGYPGYSPGLIGHPGLATGPGGPFVPPTHGMPFQPKSLSASDPTKPKIVKSGKWNAMHVRVAWEIYHHQQKSGDAKGTLSAISAKPGVPSTADILRAPSHLFSPGMHSRPPELGPYPPSLAHRSVGYDQPPHHPGSLFATSAGHLGKSPFSATSSMSPFTRYAGGPLGGSTTSPFSMSPFAPSRDAGHLGLSPLHHDPWRMQRTLPGFPPSVNPLPPSLPGLPPGPAPWTLKPDPVLEQREREAREREERERERLRREREERERREREEKQRRLEQQQQQERERERREKERREMERRENERREREREMLLHQQRLAAESAAKQTMSAPVIRERSPLRNGQPEMADIRVKEEPRPVVKEEDLLARTDHRYHPYLRHPSSLQPPPPSALDRSRMLTHPLPPHYAPPASHWPPTTMASDPFYRYGYNPLMETMRPLDDRAAAAASYYGAYNAAAAHHAQLRYAIDNSMRGHSSPHVQFNGVKRESVDQKLSDHFSSSRPKDPSMLHMRGGPGPPPPVHKMSGTPPSELHKKEESR